MFFFKISTYIYIHLLEEGTQLSVFHMVLLLVFFGSAMLYYFPIARVFGMMNWRQTFVPESV